ncbi:MAG: hypothetical protein IJZ30_02510 [Alphaproteobacteria bacterium]|nr:hypothetical protein [Alphaproteobacteria bacterium]
MSNIINIEDVILDDSERQRCEIYSRVMGYIRPTTEYNVGKLGEFKSRLCFCEERAVAGCETRECVCGEALAMAAE